MNISTIKLKNNELYRIQGVETKTRTSNNKLVYLSIVQRANLDTFKLLKYTETLPNFIPLKIKTDCVYGAYNPKWGKPKIPKSDAFGAMRLDSKPPKLNSSTREPRENLVVFIKNNWQENPKHVASETEYYDRNNILEYNRVFVNGITGSAKSFMVRKLQKKLGDKSLLLKQQLALTQFLPYSPVRRMRCCDHSFSVFFLFSPF